MEGAEALFPGDGCGGDPMDFSWTADGEKHPDPAACASPGRDDEATSASTPVPSPQEMAESMILVPGPRVVMSGLRLADCRSDDCVLFINAGGGAIESCDPCVKVSGDSFFEGGDVIETNESIAEGGDCPFIYHSARYGSFSYKFDGLAPGAYFLDLHFAEILYTCGPKGISMFDVLVQDEKILSQLDVYAVVGGNRALQVRDIRVTVEMNGAVMINFKGVRGSPMVCGICIRKAPLLSANSVTNGNVLCKRCSSDIDVSTTQTRTSKLISKYEKQIEELTSQCTMKSNECYMAWSSVDTTNVELGRLKIELHQKGAEMENLVQTLGRESDQLRNVSRKYKNDKKLWVAAISNLERKIKAMKQEQQLLSLEAHDCANAIPDLSKMIGAVKGLVAQCEDLKLKYYEEMDKRKKLHNIVQETKGNIRVFCRCRPLSKDEVSSGQKCVVDFDGSSDGDIVITNGGTKKTFKFDRVFTPKDDQDIVYADASPLVTSVLDGYNVCIFAYGQTGTGKTFTMEGTESNRGVNYRTLEELFNIAEERKESVTYDLSVSVLEVYNEQIRDLLATSPSKKLEIKPNSEGQNHVPGLVEAKIENINEVWKVLQTGSNARAVGSNNVNEHSSRSHCMLCITVRAKNQLNGECTSSKLWLVDLAGSERLAKTDVQGERLKEAQNINRSLSALGDVISALATKNSHIPYRNSKLTHLLQDSLGGDSKALMFVQISPSDNDVSETLSSLNFASRVRRIELGPAKKHVDTAELQKTKQTLERAKQELRLKDDSLRKLEENLQNLESKAKGKEQLCKNLQEKVKELEGQLDSKAQCQITSEKQQRQLSGKLKEKEEMCNVLQQKIADLECKLRQPQQSESEVALLKQTIQELEVKLKEQQHDRSAMELSIKEMELRFKEEEHQRSVAELKIKELELKLKEQEHQRSVAELKAREIGHELLETQRTESMLQIKLRELESKAKEQDTNMTAVVESRVVVATPVNAKVMSEKENHVLRISNSLNKQLAHVENTPEAPEAACNERKRKGEARNASIGGGEQENTNNGGRKRSLPAEREARLKRKSTEPPPQVKNLVRSTASSRAAAKAAAAAAPSSRAGGAKQQPGGGNKTRGWVR
ncbi:kinesin-like protein KIN-14E [Zea mays]|uniref:Di-glucose binding protein with Kinesin motor domain n=1 Tax=Zea mays TaxID=4577 RepID=A0A1D6JL54_MAIZE|nr:kinesin-like protein KIN-14E [Zea mays]ONL92879.1 Di-glucose binding protein with Kinesin motor domain [Zea mays]ONL92882.1 Di-glucose binding protein with Kinesin motor domain [Zea mays]|eukprot:XP_008650026.1 kinesin-like protein KIN-14E [Zea mays]